MAEEAKNRYVSVGEFVESLDKLGNSINEELNNRDKYINICLETINKLANQLGALKAFALTMYSDLKNVSAVEAIKAYEDVGAIFNEEREKLASDRGGE